MVRQTPEVAKELLRAVIERGDAISGTGFMCCARALLKNKATKTDIVKVYTEIIGRLREIANDEQLRQRIKDRNNMPEEEYMGASVLRARAGQLYESLQSIMLTGKALGDEYYLGKDIDLLAYFSLDSHKHEKFLMLRELPRDETVWYAQLFSGAEDDGVAGRYLTHEQVLDVVKDKNVAIATYNESQKHYCHTYHLLGSTSPSTTGETQPVKAAPQWSIGWTAGATPKKPPPKKPATSSKKVISSDKDQGETMEPKAPTDPKVRAALEAKLEAWQERHEWMVFDPSTCAMKCRQCIANPSVKGRTREAWVDNGCTRWQEPTLKSHESSKAHRDSVEYCKLRDAASDDSDVPLIQSLAQSEETMGPIVTKGYAHAEAAYYLAQTCGAARQFPGLLNSMARVADVLGAKSTISVSKRTHKAPPELLGYHQQVLEKDFLEELAKSPVIGAGIDESTDVSDAENAVVYVYYVNDGEPKCKYLKLKRLASGNAEAVKDAFCDILQKAGLLDKLICFGSDGASVMLGAKTGVAARLREDDRVRRGAGEEG